MTAFFVVFVFGLIVGYAIGLFKERIEWNKLIQQGKLPKPF